MRGTEQGIVAHSPEEHGIVADTYLHRPHERTSTRRTKRLTVLWVVLGFASVLLLQIAADVPGEDAATAQETGTEQPDDSYEFAVYTLNHTSRVSTENGTAFTFDSGQLPFDFREVIFGEFRGDTEFSCRYYAGMSMLAQAEGQNASIRFVEANGKTIEDIAYQGQTLVVLNGWESVSRDSKGRIIDHSWGSMQIAAYDWRDGLWSPEQGIVAEHPANVTASSAALCLMVYEPGKGTEIPELRPAAACLALAIVVMLARGRRRQREVYHR